MTLNILGTEYSLEILNKRDDPYLEEVDGYCDKSTKRIVVAEKSEKCELGDFDSYQRKVIRHEIIHAFLFESGLHENFTHDMGHDETYVDWIAAQYPKIKRVFAAADCED